MHQIKVPAVVFPGQSSPDQVYRVGHDLLARRAPQQALELIEPVLAEQPTNTGLRTLRAWAFYQRAQLAKAETELTDLVRAHPDQVWLRHLLGRTLERRSKLAEALPHLRLAAAMSADAEHEAAVRRVERRVAEAQVRVTGSSGSPRRPR